MMMMASKRERIMRCYLTDQQQQQTTSESLPSWKIVLWTISVLAALLGVGLLAVLIRSVLSILNSCMPPRYCMGGIMRCCDPSVCPSVRLSLFLISSRSLDGVPITGGLVPLSPSLIYASTPMIYTKVDFSCPRPH